jgi:polyisoprenoid-binding protein YceI
MSITTTDTRQALPVGTWALDPVHSRIAFEVDYLAGAFHGHFREVTAKLQAEGDDTPVLTGSAKVASVDVQDENLAAHIQSPDFFDAERHPELSFESSDLERAGDQITVRGGITIKGVEKPVELTGTISEPITDPYGRERIALKLDTTVDRTEFGVNWNVPLPDGKPALADEVKLAAELQFVKEA